MQTQLNAIQNKIVDINYTSATATTNMGGNLNVSGNINGVQNSKFAYLTGITSDIQTQINNANTNITTANNNITTLQTRTTGTSYSSGTLTTTYANNLVVSGNINGVQNSKFAYLTGITSDIQT